MSVPIPQDNLVLPTGRISQSWQRFLTLLRSQIEDAQTYVPTVFATTGTITTVEARARYQKIGNQIVLNGYVSVTDNGTGAGALFVRLPTAVALPSEQTAGSCIQLFGTAADKLMQLSLGDQVGGFPFNPSYQSMVIKNADGTYPAIGPIYYSIVYWFF